MPPSALVSAIQRFNRGERSDSWREYAGGWKNDPHHKFAISYQGASYPVKEIIRLAVRAETGSSFSNFSGGSQANGYARQRGVEIVLLRKDQARSSQT